MSVYKIIDKYRPKTYAVIRAVSPESAIRLYRRRTGDDQPVVAHVTKW